MTKTIKNRTKEQLIEDMYTLTLENDNLTSCLNVQDTMIRQLSDTIYNTYKEDYSLWTKFMNFIRKPFIIAEILLIFKG